MLTRNIDTDREILKYVEDSELLNVCSINKTFWNRICDDNFLMRRLMKYAKIEKYKGEKESWKHFFNRLTKRVVLLKKIFDFEYVTGDFNKQYKILRESENNSSLLLRAARTGDCELVKYAIRKDMNVNSSYNKVLIEATARGHLEIIKYLEGIGTDIHVDNDRALRFASHYGHLETVKYLLHRGANVHAFKDDSLFCAITQQNFEVAKLLLEYGANINADNEVLLREISKGRLHIVQYLVENGIIINHQSIHVSRQKGHTDITQYLEESYKMKVQTNYKL